MKILHYLIVLILVGNQPVGIKFKDFDSFANEVQLQNQMGCEEFSISKDRDKYIKKYFGIKENVLLEPICMTPEKFVEWMTNARNYKVQTTITETESNKIVKKEPPKDYKGTLRYKKPIAKKSLDAYLSTPFYLEVNGDSPSNLQIHTSETVSYETLKNFENKEVQITATYIEQMPNLNEQYPITMDKNGKTVPMTRKYYRVISIKLFK